MAVGPVERRLAAILAADVVGYSRLMAADEEGTLARLRALRAEFIDPTIAKHHGRIVKLMGDGTLIEFASVVDAVRCALDIQRGMAERNIGVSDEQRIDFRVGVNLGDVIIEGDDIYGGGVNIAARLEGLAQPGGILISGTAFDHAKKAEAGFRYIGRQHVKNIPEPVRAYQVLLDPAAVGTVVDDEVPTALARRRRMTLVAAATAAVVLAGSGFWLWNTNWRSPIVEAASVERMAHPLPDEPSIAVLPFENLSNDPNQEYFADGITEDILTDLSKLSGLFVIDRSSTFSYKGKAVQVKRIAEELGVRYVLQGSVRRASERVRIATQLVDALTGNHVWAERYDRDLKDVFAIQDDLARKIVSNLAVRLTEGERGRLVRQNPSNPEAYDLYLRGRSKRIPPTAENLADARALFEQAIELDPRFAGGYVGLSTIHWLSFTNLPSDSPHEQLTTALRLADRAIELDPTFGPAYGSLANALIYNRKFEDGLAAIRKAVELAPGDALMRGRYGRYLGFAGEAREGLEQLRIAQRMAPGSANVLFFLGLTYRAAGQYEKAIEILEDYRSQRGGRILANSDLQLAAAYMQAGREDNARAVVQAVSRAMPHFTLEFTSRAAPYKRPDDMAAFLDALRKAGLPK